MSKTVYKFDIKEEIAPPIWRKTKMAMAEAIAIKADIVLVCMNTYGGQVDIADSIRTLLLESKIPVYVFIENNAASAGALISIACDSIYMKPGSTIGAATVVNQSGEQVPDKYQSYMRKKMRATAEQTGRDPDMAEAMVDPDKVVFGVSDSGKVLTFTVREAVKYRFCEAEVSTIDELFTHASISNYTIIEQKLTTIDGIIDWLINPMISGILIAIMVGGIYYELQTPGLGFPIAASITATILYFAPLYLGGLAENWEIIIFIIGLILIALEVFVIPGFGVAGVVGIVFVFSGLILSLVNNIGLDFEPVNSDRLLKAVLTVVLSMVLAIGLSIFFGIKLMKTSFFSRFVLNAEQSQSNGYIAKNSAEEGCVGQTAVSTTVLRPSGKIEINNELFDATSESGYIEKGKPVLILRYETSQLVVREIK